MKIIKILFLLFVTGFMTSSTFAATIEKIDAINNNTIEVTASPDVVFSDINMEGEVKLLKDVPVSFSVKDTENPKKVLLNLTNDLNANTSYSLITILGGEGNIDFRINEFLEGEFLNANLVQTENGIEKVNIIDSRTIELYFNYDLIEDTFEFKILSELETSGLKSTGNNVFDLGVTKNLEKATNYIVMILSLKDATGKPVVLSEDLYDLVTPADLVQAVTEEPMLIAETQPVAEVITATGNIEQVALNTKVTPETGTATNILLFIAFILSFGLLFRKKFAK